MLSLIQCVNPSLGVKRVALASPRQSAVDGEIARVLAASGGHITDSMEREIMQKLLGSDWSLP